MKTKVLILHTSVGGGIQATSANVAEQLTLSGNFEVKNFDIEKLEAGVFSSLFRESYLTILDYLSPLWGFLYDSKIVLALTLPLRKFAASFKSRNVLQILREFQPPIVVSTGVVPSSIMAYLKAKGFYRGKFVIVFSDYHLHRFWLHKEADLFVCNIPQQAEELRRLGFDENKIVLTGTLIAEKFHKEVSREQALAHLGLLTTMPVVLVGGAGRARLSTKEVFLQLLRSPKSFQVAVICGRNEQLKKELSKISAPAPHPVKILGYIDNMDVWMSAADALVYKTGGPSMAEAVVKKLPIVFVDVHPGHEQTNLKYLLSHGIGQYARTSREAAFLVEQILEGKVKSDWKQAYETIVKPPNSISIADAVAKIRPSESVKIAKVEGLTVKNYQSNI